MHTLEGLRRQIDTASDLGSIVSTMKTLAAVSIRQYERAVAALDDYNRVIELGFQIVLQHQRLRQADVGGRQVTGAVVFGTDQGMCGRFNEEILSFVQHQQVAAQDVSHWRLLAVGHRVQELLQEAGLPVAQTFPVPTAVTEISGLVQELLPQVEHWHTETELTRFWVIHNRRTSAASYSPERQQLLPIDQQLAREWSATPWDSRSLPYYTMDRRRLVSQIIRQHLFVSLFRACAESLASENASRIAAMHAAEKNIEERLDELRGVYNRLRQTAITEELLDVITGFEALAAHEQAREPNSKFEA